MITLALTEEQEAAAQAGPAGAFLIAAGPGTGKTFTMVERFCWLVERVRVEPERILAVTFTEKAAAELLERIGGELRRRGHREAAAALDTAWIGTFHGVCARLLREDAYLVGLPREVEVLDELDQKLLLERLGARLRSGAEPSVDPESLRALHPEDVDSLLSSGLRFVLKLKGRGISADQFRERALELHTHHHHGSEFPAARAEKEAITVLHAVYAAYERHLDERGLMDFDDLILTTIAALDRVPDFAARCHQRFRYLLVDEFQDTNRIQLELIRRLGAPGFGNVAAVGDAKQSIYGWRDADIENIRSRFEGRRLPLTQNRRSYQEILDCASAFIARDPEFAAEPALVAQRGTGGACVNLVMAADSKLEARLVASEIRRLAAAGRRYSEIAVLAHSVRLLPREFEDELRRHLIPYVTSGGSGFFDRQEVKDVVALLRLVENPLDDGALVRVLQGPVVRLDDAGVYRLARPRFEKRALRLRDCLDAAEQDLFDSQLAERARSVLAVTDRLAAMKDALTVADVLNRLLEETGYLRHAQLRAAREGPRALLNLRKVFAMAGRFEREMALAGIGDFVRHLDSIMDAELPVGEATEEAPEAVSLLTVHAAKGLEFPVVFLVNLRPPRPRDTERWFFDPDGLGFVMKYWGSDKHPRFKQSLPSTAGLELALQERRRAVYVAMTRAQDLLYVSATREEASPAEVDVLPDDHFSELMSWALGSPERARVVVAEQLELPQLRPPAAASTVDAESVAAVLGRLELMAQAEAAAATAMAAAAPVQLSFSQLHQFEVCPVRYRFSQVWRVPAPPDELLPPAAGEGSTELGRAVHEALAAHHQGGGDLLRLYSGPPDGEEMLRRYLEHPLARAETLGVELEFNLRLGGLRLKGFVDRVCVLDGRTVLVDYKTNAKLDERLQEVYSLQLRLYGLAAQAGILPGGGDPMLCLFDLRRGEAITVAPDPAGAQARLELVAARIAAGDFSLGPEHARRPCWLCAYRPLCPDART
ncbi:MAG TPA: ATP-dependent DNA helicase [Candidatus Acidoferrales bacterium]|nr:ATP-dependent DNA helicase [Candidatus Acidoferrales bacterium]